MVFKNNGTWTNTTLNIPELIASFIKAWLEDAINEEFINGVKNSKGGYTPEKQKEKLEEVYTGLFKNRIGEMNANLETLNQELNNTKINVA